MVAREARSRPLVSALVHRRVSLHHRSVGRANCRACNSGHGARHRCQPRRIGDRQCLSDSCITCGQPHTQDLHRTDTASLPKTAAKCVVRRQHYNAAARCLQPERHVANVLYWLRSEPSRRARQQRAVWAAQVPRRATKFVMVP